jgi:hypothetical protein
MSLFKRVNITDSTTLGLPSKARAGAGMMDNISWTEKTTNADHTITVAEMSGGGIQYTSFSAGRAVTTPTAALILAAAPDMDVGDSFSFLVSCVAAFAATWTAGTGVTLAGRATTPASSWSIITVKKLSSTTVEWRVS